MEELFIQLLTSLGPPAAIAGLAFYFFDKKDTRAQETIEKIVQSHKAERKEWNEAKEESDEKRDEKITKAITYLADSIRYRTNPSKEEQFLQGIR